jgi:hypothetical protein
MPDSRSLQALNGMVTDSTKHSRIYLQLLVFVMFSTEYARFTYYFESDSFLVDEVFDRLQALGNFGRCKYSVWLCLSLRRSYLCSRDLCPAFCNSGGESCGDFKAQLDHLAAGDVALRATLRAAVSAIVNPAVQWFDQSVLGPTGHLGTQLPLYQAARVISPYFLSAHSVAECMAQFQFLRSRGLLAEDDMKGIDMELPLIQQELQAHPLAPNTKTVPFWKSMMDRFPALCLVLRKIAVLRQTSASAERVFSLLEQLFTSQQEASALVDYLQVALMCRYNLA